MRRTLLLLLAVLTLASSALLVQPSRAVSNDPDPAQYPTGWAKPDAYIGAKVTDAGGSGIDTEASYVTLDGVALPSYFTNGHLRAEGRGMAEGPHEAGVVVFDRAGNKAVFTWPFSVDAGPPVLGEGSPTGTINDRTPLITLPATDSLSGIRTDALTLTFSRRSTLQVASSTTFNVEYDEAAGLVSYQVPDVPNGPGFGHGPLPDGTYDIILSVNDWAGHTQLRAWSFTVSTLPVEVPFGY